MRLVKRINIYLKNGGIIEYQNVGKVTLASNKLIVDIIKPIGNFQVIFHDDLLDGYCIFTEEGD